MAVGRLFIRENFQKESKETVTFGFSSSASPSDYFSDCT